MPNKNKKSSPVQSASTSRSSSRPSLLGITVLVAGATSAWYWLEPSPPSLEDPSVPSPIAVGVNHAAPAQPLIEPNTNESISVMSSGNPGSSGVRVYASLPEDLVGSQQVELRPFANPTAGTLQDRLAKEPLPIVPISRSDRSVSETDKARLAGRPSVWSQQGSDDRIANTTISSNSWNSSSDSWDQVSPFRSGANAIASQPLPNSPGTLAIALPSERQSPEARTPEVRSPAIPSPATPSTAIRFESNPPLTAAIRPEWRQAVPGALAGTTKDPKIRPSDDPLDSTSVRSIPTAWSSPKPTEPSANPSQESNPRKKSGAVIRQPKNYNP